MSKLLFRLALFGSLLIIVSSDAGKVKTIENGIISGVDKIKEIGSVGSKNCSTDKATEWTPEKSEEDKDTDNRTPTPIPSKCYKEAESLIIPANTINSGKILKELMKLRPSKNMLYSSPVTWNSMSQVGAYSHGDAYTQVITKTLYFENLKQVKCYFPRILAIIMKLPAGVEYKFIAKIYSDDVCPLTSDFKKQIKELYVFEPTNLNFQDPKSAKFISQEVAEATNNHIVDYIKPKLLSSLSSLVLVTAVSFRAQWQKPFNPIYTKERDFYVSMYKRIKVRTMHQKGTFLFAENSVLGAKILKMKYVGDDYSLVVMLPTCINGIDDVVDKIRDPDLVSSALDSLKMETVHIYLPTFNITVSNKLKLPEERINVTEIFHNETAGLEDITTCNGTYVSTILQKATFQLDEYGGWNATDVETEKSSEEGEEESFTFRADRPFIYCMFYRKYIVYLGVHYY